MAYVEGDSIMVRSVKVRKPRIPELRRLHAALEENCNVRQRRRIEAILLHGAGMNAVTIAGGLGSHVTTIYADLRAFEQEGVDCIHHRLTGGAPARLTEAQQAEILRLADSLPADVGWPYGRWSLSKLREYLLNQGVVSAISREHLRRLLKKGDCVFAVSNAS
jgi:transposase